MNEVKLSNTIQYNAYTSRIAAAFSRSRYPALYGTVRGVRLDPEKWCVRWVRKATIGVRELCKRGALLAMVL